MRGTAVGGGTASAVESFSDVAVLSSTGSDNGVADDSVSCDWLPLVTTDASGGP
jgi:hypothetical protein